MNKPYISVIVASEGKRERKLTACIRSILRNSYTNFELVVIVQNKIILSIGDLRLKVMVDRHRGVSYAKNLGIQKAKGKILCFTDDDCIVSKNWISAYQKAFLSHPETDGIFAPVKPCLKNRMTDHRCLSLFDCKTSGLFDTPLEHDKVGCGNNMAFRKESIVRLGGFVKWHGPFRMKKSADDAELILRSLGSGQKLLYVSANNYVRHDNWVSIDEYKKQELDYLLADTACYTYYFFQYSFARKRLYNRWKVNLRRYLHILRKIPKELNKITRSDIYYVQKESFTLLKGMIIGIYQKISVL